MREPFGLHKQVTDSELDTVCGAKCHGVGASRAIGAERVIDGVAARYAEHLPAISGGTEAVRRMAEHHVVGVASSSPRRLIDLVIHELGLDGVFTATVSTEEVAAGKPAPDDRMGIVEVRDQGFGIDQGDLPRLFQPLHFAVVLPVTGGHKLL